MAYSHFHYWILDLYCFHTCHTSQNIKYVDCSAYDVADWSFCVVVIPWNKVVLVCPPTVKRWTLNFSIDISFKLFTKKTNHLTNVLFTCGKLLFVQVSTAKMFLFLSFFQFFGLFLLLFVELTWIFREGIKTQPYLRLLNHDIMNYALGIVHHCLCFDTDSNSNTTYFITYCNTESPVLAHPYPAPAWCKCSVKSSGSKTAT